MTYLDYQQRKSRRLDLTAWACPRCAFESKTHTSRTCPGCGYTGDWVQPGEYLTYAERSSLTPAS